MVYANSEYDDRERRLGPYFKTIANPALFGKEVKENRMAIGIAQQIITEGISDQIAVNIMDLEDPKEMWERL